MLLRSANQFVSALLLSTLLAAQGPGDEVRCDYVNRQACFREGCKPANLPGNYVLVPSIAALNSAARGTGGKVDLRLCDPQGCTPVAMRVLLDGEFMELTQANGGVQYMKLYVLREKEPLHG